MTTTHIAGVDKELDLVLERYIAVPPALVWRALTEPELLKKWFCPLPWQTVDCRIDARPGGEFYTEMQSPEGMKFPNNGCFLDVVPGKRLVSTSALEKGFRPALPGTKEGEKECAAIVFTCSITLEAKGSGTYYTAHVMHGSQQQQQAHVAMGFHEGWGAALTQMVELLETMEG